MSIALDLFCFAFPLTMMFIYVLSIATSVGGCWWPISARAILMDVAFWKFSNNPPDYAYVVDAITFLIMLHYTCTGPISGGISCIGVLYFGPRKNILPLCFMPPVLICRIHPSKCEESFCLFCILLLHLNVLRCNLEIE